MDDRTATTTVTREQLAEAIELAEARLKQLHNWALTRQIARLRDLEARLLELEAWEAEPRLLRPGEYSGL
jgi:hypothetical protein